MVVALAGCDLGRPSALSAQIAARQEVLDPPQLWRAEQLASGGIAVAAVHVCAAEVHRAAFLRPGVEVNGRPCATFGPAVDTPRLHQTRCQADGRDFQVRIDSSGDPATAFTTTLAIRPLDALSPPTVVTRRYTIIGPCPKGWPVGRQARTALPELG
ncbi:hypothetical protein DJ018_04675 [Phenylobacterium deserti]|uniref:DUF3617 domain-containing protein n=2 Tax=Phenylobacterium deserti TaxID=1914756 RepID=A0A328ASF4_9CAUL|nr:hypothetical protein DJ018_04675 [Phenylobacterium deserti]